MQLLTDFRAALLTVALIVTASATRAAVLTPEQAIEEAKAICQGDGGALWGMSLCGPLLLVEPATRTVWASEPDGEGKLQAEGAIFTGKLPDEINIANTAVDWAGRRWTMLMWPLPEEKTRRAALLAHEMWHRVQGELGFPASGAANNHLATRDGRFWLQLEWRALAAALLARGDERERAIADAALFRARRRALFPQAASEEREMEMHEGLAEYTGVKLSGAADLARYVAETNLKEAPAKKTFIRSFAYANGPAYGVLLDAVDPDWRKTLRSGDDLGQMLFTRAGLKLPADIAAAADERARAYGGDELARSEDERERTTRELMAAYRARLIDGAALALPLRQMQMQFNPTDLVALEPHGTVYPNIRIVDVWGILTVSSGGALMGPRFDRVTVSAPTDPQGAVVQGDGWKLELKSGWKIIAGERAGDFILVQEP